MTDDNFASSLLKRKAARQENKAQATEQEKDQGQEKEVLFSDASIATRRVEGEPMTKEMMKTARAGWRAKHGKPDQSQSAGRGQDQGQEQEERPDLYRAHTFGMTQ